MSDDTEECQLSGLIDVLMPFDCYARCYSRPSYCAAEEAAKLLGIGRSLAYQRAASGELPVIGSGRRPLISKPALDKPLETPPPFEASVAKQKGRKAL